MRSPHLADSRPPYTGQPRPTTIASGARPASRSRQQSAPRDRLPGRHLEALAAKIPSDTDSQRGLIVALVKVAQLAAQEGRNTEARAHYGEALRIARALASTGRLRPVDAWLPGELERRLGDLPP